MFRDGEDGADGEDGFNTYFRLGCWSFGPSFYDFSYPFDTTIREEEKQLFEKSYNQGISTNKAFINHELRVLHYGDDNEFSTQILEKGKYTVVLKYRKVKIN